MKWTFIIFAYCSLFALSFIDNGRGPAYPEMLKTFSIPASIGSYFFSITSFTGIIINLTSKFWYTKLGAITATKLGLMFLSISSFTIYYASKISSVPLLMFSSFILGIGLAILGITMNILVVKGTKIEHKRKVFSGLHSVYGAASFMAPFLFSLVISLNFKWYEYFILTGIIPIIFLIFHTNLKGNSIEKKLTNQLHIPIPFSKRIPFGIVFGCYVAAEIIISSRLVLYLRQNNGLSSIEASRYLSMFFAFLLLGRLIFSIKNIKLKSKNLMYTSLISTLCCFYLGMYVHPFFLPFLGFCMSYFFPVSMDWLSNLFVDGIEFMTVSVMTYIAIMLGIVHWFFGYLVDNYGISNAFLLVPLLIIISLIHLIYIQTNERVHAIKH